MPNSGSDDSNVTFIEDPAERVFLDALQTGGPGKIGCSDDAQKWLFFSHFEDTLEFTVVGFPEEKVFGPYEKSIRAVDELIADLLKTVAEFLKSLSGSNYGPSASNTNRPVGPGEKSQLENLKALGERVYKRLIPPNLQSEISKWKDSTWVGVSSRNDFIPWELLHDGERFIGERFRFYRLPKLPPHDEAIREIRPISYSPSKLYDKNIVHVIGGNLGVETLERCKKHFGNISASVTELEERYLEEVLEAIQQAHLIHFTCHGLPNPLRLQVAKSADPTVNLIIGSIRHYDMSLIDGCVVFANACNSAGAEPVLGEFRSLGLEFYLKGAGVVIGTIGTIPADVAVDLANSFYEALKNDPDGNVFSAFYAAKNNGSDQPANKWVDKSRLLRQLYSIYGNPRRVMCMNFGSRKV